MRWCGYVDGHLVGFAHYLLSSLDLGAGSAIVIWKICSSSRSVRGGGLGRALIAAVDDGRAGGGRQPGLLVDARSTMTQRTCAV